MLSVKYISHNQRGNSFVYQDFFVILYIDIPTAEMNKFYKYTYSTQTGGESSVIASIQGYTMTEIGDKMCLSPETIKKYRNKIFEKLGLRNITVAIIAIR